MTTLINKSNGSWKFEGKYQNDLHLYVQGEGRKYGDLRIVINAKEDINSEATPCITITLLLAGQTTKANNISLVLDKWAPFDMLGSKRREKKSHLQS